jgi:hypothetical protein
MAQSLHANAMRVVGTDLSRLVAAAERAFDVGREFWFSPALYEATQDRMLGYLVEAATAAERSYGRHPGKVVFLCGSELTLFVQGIVPERPSPPGMRKPSFWETVQAGRRNAPLDCFLRALWRQHAASMADRQLRVAAVGTGRLGRLRLRGCRPLPTGADQGSLHRVAQPSSCDRQAGSNHRVRCAPTVGQRRAPARCRRGDRLDREPSQGCPRNRPSGLTCRFATTNCCLPCTGVWRIPNKDHGIDPGPEKLRSQPTLV